MAELHEGADGGPPTLYVMCKPSARAGGRGAVSTLAAAPNSEISIASAPLDADVRRALERLTALHEGYRGVTDVVATGRRAVPALKALLMRPEPSGIFEPRCRAVAALAALGAIDACVEFLELPRQVADPTGRVGEEVVRSAAARALSGVRDERVFPLLLQLAKRQPLAGVIEALGSFGRPEAIPGLISGLYEDYSRPCASAALLRLGKAARPALLRATRATTGRHPTAAALRARRCAVSLLAQIGLAARQRSAVRELIWDDDPEISARVCLMCLGGGAQSEKDEIVARLAALAPGLPSPIEQTVRDCLATFGGEAAALANPLPAGASVPASTPGRRRLGQSLSRFGATAAPHSR